MGSGGEEVGSGRHEEPRITRCHTWVTWERDVIKPEDKQVPGSVDDSVLDVFPLQCRWHSPWDYLTSSGEESGLAVGIWKPSVPRSS